jgi:Tfp pilus assembly protein PilF
MIPPPGYGPLPSPDQTLADAEELLKAPRAGDWFVKADKLVLALESKAQETVLGYLAGEDFELQSDDFSDAASRFDLAAKLNPTDTSLTVRRDFCTARALLFGKSLANYDSALILLDRTILLDPFQSYLYNARGVTRLERMRFKSDPANEVRAAERDFEVAMLLDPFWAYPRHNLALAQQYEAEGPEAEHAYKQAILWAAYYGLGSGYLRHNLGSLYAREQRWNEARSEFNAAANAYSEARHRFVARMSRAAFDKDPVVQAWAASRAIYMKRSEAEAINALGATYAVSGSYKRAAREYRRALGTDANSTETYRNLGLVVLKKPNRMRTSRAPSNSSKSPRNIARKNTFPKRNLKYSSFDRKSISANVF